MSLALGVILLAIASLPFSNAAPVADTVRQVFAAAQEEPKPTDDPGLWVYLATAAALVLLGGAFAGLTIAYA
jgi:metal transporter CNNM